MKKPTTIVSFMLILCFVFAAFTGCKDNATNVQQIPIPTDPAGEPLASLVGTKWKLIGFADAETNTMKEPEPKSDSCYILVFSNDAKISGMTSTNAFNGEYEINYILKTFKIQYTIITEINELGDGILYSKSLQKSSNFSATQNFLKLFYDGEKKYLLFKPLLK